MRRFCLFQNENVFLNCFCQYPQTSLWILRGLCRKAFARHRIMEPGLFDLEQIWETSRQVVGEDIGVEFVDCGLATRAIAVHSISIFGDNEAPNRSFIEILAVNCNEIR